MTSSMERGARLKGSFESDNRCDLIVDRSMMVLDEGSMTGSRMTVAISGSAQRIMSYRSRVRMCHIPKNSSGISPRSSSASNEAFASSTLSTNASSC